MLGAGGPPPSGLSAEESSTYEQLNFLYTKGLGYGVEIGTQPPTLYGVAAWRPAWRPGCNVTFYWLTNTGVSSGRLYWENPYGFFDAKNVSIPAAVSVFPHELYKTPRSWGNHFAAWQEPALFAGELRAAFRSLH